MTDFTPADVLIKPVDDTDISWIQKYAADPRISATCNVPYPYPEDGAATFVRAAIEGQGARTHYVFAVRVAGEFAGLMTLNGVDNEFGTASLDYWIAVPFWGRGIGSAAASQLVNHAFRVLRLNVLRSGCLESNPASARVLLKCGFAEAESIIHDGAGSGRFSGKSIRLFELRHSDWRTAKRAPVNTGAL